MQGLLCNLKDILRQAPVAHAWNPSYSGGRDQEDHDSKPVQANIIVPQDLSQKNTLQKRAGRVAEGVGPQFNPQLHPPKKKTF
jgi:hypothetical protein